MNSSTTTALALLPLCWLALPALSTVPAANAGEFSQDPVRGRSNSRDPKRAPIRAEDPLNKKILELKAEIQARGERNVTGQTAFVDAAQIMEWFTICDHNSNSWLSFSETSHSLHFSRKRFQAFDSDRDGRFAQGEFEDFYRYSILNGRAFTPPTPAARKRKPPHRSAIQLRNAYDTDLDRALSSSELSRLLVDYGHESSEAEAVIQSLDESGEGMLSTAELATLPSVLHPVDLGNGLAAPIPSGAPTSLLELFGTPLNRFARAGSAHPSTVPLPPLIIGPVPHFRRLDLDNDGFITVDDLEQLLRPMRVSVRPHTVINTLDGDGDFKLSPEEFHRALGGIEK
jgi:Ca2+-binding EF-hand superfamily protein